MDQLPRACFLVPIILAQSEDQTMILTDKRTKKKKIQTLQRLLFVAQSLMTVVGSFASALTAEIVFVPGMSPELSSPRSVLQRPPTRASASNTGTPKGRRSRRGRGGSAAPLLERAGAARAHGREGLPAEARGGSRAHPGQAPGQSAEDLLCFSCYCCCCRRMRKRKTD